MSEQYSDILIIGGGAAGMMAGIAAEKSFGKQERIAPAGGEEAKRIAAGDDGVARVTILEKMPRPGRKIVITGKGRCNLTNFKDWEDFSEHVHPAPNFLKNAFFNFSPRDVVDFFQENGLETVTERGDRVFPASYKSMDVVDALVRTAEREGVNLQTGTEVIGIEKDSDSGFIVRTATETWRCKKLILATGGLSYPGTGSTGDGYRWAKELGLGLTPCFPSLTAVVPKGYKIAVANTGVETDGKAGNGAEAGACGKGHVSRNLPLSETGKLLNGNSLKNVTLKVWIDGQLAAEEFGDLDFSDGGIEGPIGFKVSRQCVKALRNGAKVKISIDLKPAVSLEKLNARISDPNLRKVLRSLLPSGLIQGFLRTTHLKNPARLGRALKNWEFDIEGYVGYERCVITAGGVSTKELSPKTLECKNIPNLHIAGEVLDLDCDTGGYNLQCAFSTGWLAGEAAARELR